MSRHNPLASELEDAEAALANLRDRRAELVEELRWHGQFDAAANAAERRAAAARATALRDQLDDTETRLGDAETVLNEHRDDAALGWRPSRWFSAERGAAKQRYAEQQDVVGELRAEWQDMELQLVQVEARSESLERDRRRYDGIDAAARNQELARTEDEVASREVAVADLARRKERLDRRLAPLLSQLRDREREAARLNGLLADAEAYQHQLDYAANGYERKLVHVECERRLGRSSPGAVIHDVQRERRALERDVEKLERRIAEEVRRGSRDVRAVVIDGNNLCYEGDHFIGLAAVLPVTAALSHLDVTVVFDRSIETRWRLPESMLTALLPAVTVHVARSRRSADELILDAARDPYSVVLSNDRFGEFRDKDAVRAGRVVRHDVLKGRVCVPDLEIDVPLAALPSEAAAPVGRQGIEP